MMMWWCRWRWGWREELVVVVEAEEAEVVVVVHEVEEVEEVVVVLEAAELSQNDFK